MVVDIDMLRDYLRDHCASALFSGFEAALLDAADVERME